MTDVPELPGEVDELVRVPGACIVEAMRMLHDACKARQVQSDLAAAVCRVLKRAGEALAAGVNAEREAQARACEDSRVERELRAQSLAREREARRRSLVQPN